jgi:hypothetical protein
LSAAQGQAYQRGNQIQQAYGQRGLANSGLQQYGQIANRQAMGQTVNQLAGQNAEVARAAMDASKGISQNLQNTLMKARLQSDAQMAERDQMLYEQQKGEQEAQFQRALQYMDLMGIDPSTDAGKSIMAQLFQGQVGGDLQAQIEAAANAPIDLLETSGAKRTNVGAFGKAQLASAELIADVLRLNKGDFAANNPWAARLLSTLTNPALMVARNQSEVYTYDIGGTKVQASNKADAEKQLTELYKNKQYISNGQIKIFVDATSGRVSFIDNRTGKQSKTYNEAVNKLKGV